MTVSMGILHRPTGDYDVVCVATSATFNRVWRPAAQLLGLELVAEFAGGALTTVADWQIPLIIAEVERLRKWLDAEYGADCSTEACENILEPFARTDRADCEYDFG